MNDFGLLVSQYNSTLPTLTDGDFSELQVDVNGRLLVQADVTVLIDFLGLNGAADSANILIVGTEDGTSGGTAHAVRLDTGGQVIISDGGSSITVDATDLDIRDLSASQDNVAISDGTDTMAVNADGSINSVVTATDLDIRDITHVSDSIRIGDGTDLMEVNADGSINSVVTATDLDIRDLSASQDNVAISDGTDTLEVNADGSINVQATVAATGTEEYESSDDAADGILPITTTYAVIASLSVGAGETGYIYGWQFDSDSNAQAKLVIRDSAADTEVLKVRLNSSALPGIGEHFSEGGRIEIAGAANRTVDVMVKTRNGTGNASGSIHARKA